MFEQELSEQDPLSPFLLMWDLLDLSKDYVKGCEVCLTTKAEYPSKNTVPVHIETSRPFQVLAIDFCSVEKSSSGKEHILVITDLFSKFVWAFDTKDQKATTVAKILIDEIFYKFGIPEKIHSDQGRNFESRLFGNLCLLEKTPMFPPVAFSLSVTLHLLPQGHIFVVTLYLLSGQSHQTGI